MSLDIEALGRDVARRFLALAAASLVVGVTAGLLCALYYTPWFSTLARHDLVLQALRPLHTGATVLWIFFAGMAAVHAWMFEQLADRARAGDASAPALAHAVARRATAQVALWASGGVLGSALLLTGHFSGREYLEWPPVASLPFVAGWLLWVWSFVEVSGVRLRNAPVFAWMWASSAFLFLWTFVEAHAWQLSWVSDRPLQDIAVQWKSYGSLVGSYNLLVYGSLSWLNSKLAGNDTYARSNLAFALFLVGIVNSFTNYGHHTYHLPASHWVKWIAFGVSMTEVVLLVRVVWDVAKLANTWSGRREHPVLRVLLSATTTWTALQLGLAILMSIPPINSTIHGTLAVPAHAMGSLIGIDTMALFAVGVWFFEERAERRTFALTAVVATNVGLFGLWGVLLIAGVRSGIALVERSQLPSVGTFPTWLGPVLFGSGALLAFGLLALTLPWLAPARPVTVPRKPPPTPASR